MPMFNKKRTNAHEAIKAFFIDLDGTLLDVRKTRHNYKISNRNLKAIKKWRENHGEIILSTGRMGVRVRRIMEVVNPKYAILGNGSQIVVDNKVVAEFKIALPAVLKIRDFAIKHHLSVRVDDSNNAWGVKTLLRRIVARHLGFISHSDYNYDLQSEYYKIVLFGRSPSQMKALAEEMEQEIGGLEISQTNKFMLEVTTIRASKGIATTYLIEHYLKLKREQTAHVGDSFNDLSVVGRVGSFIAMRNAPKRLRDLADYIGPGFRNGGVAQVLQGKYDNKN